MVSNHPEVLADGKLPPDEGLPYPHPLPPKRMISFVATVTKGEFL